ncbi:ferritin-like domain-containing protein [Pseudoduganella sp. FT25W]|uniref:Ferritin-like domain-containing protein n=1 Tax=Duganella alba TaxID=2666081 RepID=A0A6L5QH02_9BURK|nr:ferritin-like domain-containing protein [Duganella alba]MRX08945.1 ferritin-like domain-containing protein [Duganella alba]MRX19009.1 ferritin-like domain-containing protein [Duganella alba]
MAESNPTHPAGIDTEAIRAAARNLDDGAVTSGYKGDREAVIKMLNDALATELVCINRYKRHYYTVSGRENAAIKAEFLEHANEEQEHADWLAERIVQLNGDPDFNPATLLDRSHAEYDASEDVQSMVRANLIAERVAIEAYRQMIEQIGDTDPTTRHLLIKIMAVEEEHADDMRDMMTEHG